MALLELQQFEGIITLNIRQCQGLHTHSGDHLFSVHFGICSIGLLRTGPHRIAGEKRNAWEQNSFRVAGAQFLEGAFQYKSFAICLVSLIYKYN